MPIRVVSLVLLSGMNKKVAEIPEKVNRKADSTSNNRKAYQTLAQQFTCVSKEIYMDRSQSKYLHKEQRLRKHVTVFNKVQNLVPVCGC